MLTTHKSQLQTIGTTIKEAMQRKHTKLLTKTTKITTVALILTADPAEVFRDKYKNVIIPMHPHKRTLHSRLLTYIHTCIHLQMHNHIYIHTWQCYV